MLEGYTYWDLLYMSLDIKELVFILVADLIGIGGLIYIKKTNTFYED